MEENKKTVKKKPPAKPLFSGRLLGISAGGSDAPCRFDIANKKGEKRTYLLESGDPLRLAAMTALLAGAYTARKKLHVRGNLNGGDLRIAAELRIGAKQKPRKAAPVKPEKKTEAPAAPPAP